MPGVFDRLYHKTSGFFYDIYPMPLFLGKLVGDNSENSMRSARSSYGN